MARSRNTVLSAADRFERKARRVQRPAPRRLSNRRAVVLAAIREA